MSKFDELFTAIKNRFPNAKFSVSCFKTVDEIENKILDDEHEIIQYTDLYENSYLRNDKWIKTGTWNDFFIIKRKEGKNAIYYCDVIDVLIASNFVRDEGDHRYMESIGRVYKNRNPSSIPVYSSFWGS